MPIDWDGRNSVVTLACDAAHPICYMNELANVP